jgi:DNA-binding SARP family transcriptional activator
VSTAIRVLTLGTVAIDLDDRRLGPSAGRPFALLLYLASRGGQPSSRRLVEDLLFPFSMRERAHSLRQLLYRLRRLRLPVEADDDQIALSVDRISIDWQDVLSAGTVGESELERLARGLFPGYNPNISEGFREWLDAERTDIVLRLSRVLTTQLAQRRTAGRWDLVETTARALLALDPLSEEGTLAKAEGLALAGSKSAALDLIDDYLEEVGERQQRLQLVPSVVRRRISERLPDETLRAADERQFVGREEPMRVLGALSASTRAGRQQILLLWGEPGVGKTRLLTEFRALAVLQGGYALSLSCQPHDIYRPLGVLCDLVMQLLAAPGALGCDPGARALLQRLVQANKQVDETREAAVTQVSIAAVVRSLNDLLSAVAVETSLLVFIDDVQWIDETSRTAIIGAFATRASRRSSLVLTSRERTMPAGSESQTDTIVSARLQPLNREAALALAHGLLSECREHGVDDATRQIVEQGRGNPFVIRTLCAHYVATNDVESLKHTVTELLARRLHRLPSEARRTLESAVILAKNCTFERLRRLLDVPRQHLLSTIEELDDHGLIDVTDGYLVRSHALLADVVTERMAASVIRLLHGSSAELLHRDVDASAASTLLWDCAEHWRQAGNDERAIAVLMECAHRSVESGRATDAILTLRRALGLTVLDERRLAIVERGLEISWQSHVYVEARFFTSELARLRAALGRPTQVHDNYELLETALRKWDGANSDFRTLVLQLRNCVAAADAAPHHRISAAHQLMIWAELMLDADAGRSAYHVKKEFTNVSEAHLGVEKRLAFDMIYEGGFGDPRRAQDAAREVAAWATFDSPDRYPLLINAAIAQYRIATPNEAEPTLRCALERARRYGFVYAETNVGLTLARLFWSTERLEECIGQHRLLADLVAQCEDAEVIVDYCVLGARLATTQGRYDEAVAYIRRARAFSHSQLALPDLLLRCCELDLRLATVSDNVSDAQLNELLLLHLRARQFGLHDEVMATVVKCLERNGRASEARQRLQEYLRAYRRDGFPAPSWLVGVRRESDRTSVLARGLTSALPEMV